MDRWQQISGIFHAALTRPADERDEYVRGACAGDDDLRREVESLIAATEETRTLGRQSGAPDDVRRGARVPRLISPSDKLAHYRIVSRIGVGGMGEVYRARDERLDRDIALKVLPSSDFADPVARARLVREARAAAALNHPNVCTVHEVAEAAGETYIAMEFVEGHTLGALLDDGPLPLDQIVLYGRQLADALTHAHDRGVVHRDLKTSNVIVTPDGRAKVLDFGLAKRSVDADLAVTQLQVSITQPGVAAGTLPYMAPEQLRGENATAASDIWALGAVLYEMAAGVRPFRGQTPFEMSAAILNDPPPALPARVPAALRSVIERCLEKDPRSRPSRASEVRDALAGVEPAADSNAAAIILEPPAAAAPPHPRVRPIARRGAVLASAVMAIVVIGAATAWRLWTHGLEERTLAVLPFENAAQDPDFEYLCEGIAKSLIERVTKLPSLNVRPLATVLNFKGRLDDPAAAGRDLGVASVLVGALALDGTRLKISARLLDVATGRELWTNSYDRDAGELLNVQDEIATAIMDEGLRIRLSDDEREQIVRHPTTSGEAYDLFLQAEYAQRVATEDGYLESLRLLELATAHDQRFALAYAALSGTHAMMVTDGYERPTEAWPMVSRYLRQANEINAAEAGLATYEHAYAFLFDWDWAAAAKAREKVLQIPIAEIVPDGLRALAIELWALGKPNEAVQLARRMRLLEPTAGYLASLEADLLVRTAQYEDAVALYTHAMRLEPENPNLYFGLAEARFRQKRFDEALQIRRKAHAMAGDDRLEPVFATARGEQGYRDVDRAWVLLQLEALKEREKTRYVSPLDFARAYAQLGDNDQAFRYLDASFEHRSPGLVFLKVDTAWDHVRNDSRFAAAVKRVGLP